MTSFKKWLKIEEGLTRQEKKWKSRSKHAGNRKQLMQVRRVYFQKKDKPS